MPAPTNPYDKTHLRDISSYLKKIDDIFREAAGEAAAIGASVKGKYDPGRLFSFDDYPKTKKRVESLLKGLERGIETVVADGVTAQWGLSNAKNDEAVRKALGKAADGLTREQRERYFSDHAAALEAFRERKVDGLGLSDRVWRYTDQFREEIEMGIDTGLSEGRSADQMSRDLRGYLQNPDKLFRRVRDARGNLALSRNAKAYHPGAGVYRSSYRNARRLAATETNMAYRTADHERWRDMDFVVGIEIQTSNNHTLNGKPLEDICDTLAGRYPKEFKFTGWHPQCRCFATTILKTAEEMRADNERISAGEEPLPASSSANYEGDLPKNFTEWLDANADRIADARNLPYFISDNEGLIDDGGTTKLTALEIAGQRHANRTAEEIGDIKERWADRAVRLGEDALSVAKDHGAADLTGLEKALADRDVEEILKRTNAVGTAVEKALSDIIPDVHRWHGKYTLKELDEIHDFLKDGYDSLSSEPYREQINDLRGMADSFKGKGDDFAEDIKGRYAAWEVIPDALKGKIAEVETTMMSELIPDIGKWQRQFGNGELMKVYDDVEREFGKMSDKTLEKQIQQINFDMSHLSSKDPMYGVYKDVYDRKLEELNTQYETEAIKAQLEGIGDWLSQNPGSQKVASLLRDAEAAAGGDDLEEARRRADLAAAEYQKEVVARSQGKDSAFAEDAYSDERKSNAVWDTGDGSTADKAQWDSASKAWRSNPQENRDAIYRLTTNDYTWISPPMRGDKNSHPHREGEWYDTVNGITDYIDSSSLPCDIWLRRGEDLRGLRGKVESMLGRWPADGDLTKLAGAVIREDSFLSTGSSEGAGFLNDVTMKIYAPKGTKAAYVEPFSANGRGAGYSWDGNTKAKTLGNELETTCQRGTIMRITHIERKGARWYVELEIIGQDVRDLSYVDKGNI